MNMIDEKDPGQESVHTDSSDDEVIIDLTEEITAKTEDDTGKVTLSENLTDDAQLGLENEAASKFEDDEEILALDETDEIDSLEDQVIDDADDQAAEGSFIASEINASLGAENDETEDIAKEFNLNASDDEEMAIVDDTLDEGDETISAVAENQLAEAQRDEDVFDLEEEAEQEYKWDDDEDDLIELGDERTEDNQDFAELMLGVSNESNQSDDDEEGTEYLEFETDEKDDVIVLDADRDQEAEIIALAEEETPEFVKSDDLSDLESISNFDFKDEEEVLAAEAEEPPGFKDDEDLPDLNGRADLETDDEVIPLDGFNGLEAEDKEEIIEITEFDQHFPADGEALLKQSGDLDPSGADEEDFLELIDIEEDRLSDDERIAEFSKSPEATDDDKINQFFSDELEEDQLESLTPESIFGDELEDISLENQVTESIFDDPANMKSGLDDEVLAVAEEAPGVSPESAAEAEIPLMDDQKIDFDFDHRSSAQQVDRLGTFLSENAADGPQAAPLPVDQAAEEETGLDNSQKIQGLDVLQSMPAGQVDAAIERIINEKFSDKIEGIIYEVIEKAVSKEIDRLKGALTGNK
jgi:hypothetical protein